MRRRDPGPWCRVVRHVAVAAWIVLGVCGCPATHASTGDAAADARLDADTLTEVERSVVEFFRATCEAWASCPTGLEERAPSGYAHGPDQCMLEWGEPWIAYLRASLREGSYELDPLALARCMEVLATGECPSQQRVTRSWYYRAWCDHFDVFHPPAALPIGGYCGLGDVQCEDGLVCPPTLGCPHRCVVGRALGEACGVTEPCLSPWDCQRGRCVSVDTLEVGEGEACGGTLAPSGVVDRGCAAGLYCSRTEGRCLVVPRDGQSCPDGVCAAGSFCVEDVPGEPVCALGARQEGETCRVEPETDPCDRPRGQVCVEGACASVGRSEAAPCIAFCDDGLFCHWGTQRCTPSRPDFALSDGEICEGSYECQSRWCDQRTEPHVCRPIDTPCE